LAMKASMVTSSPTPNMFYTTPEVRSKPGGRLSKE